MTPFRPEPRNTFNNASIQRVTDFIEEKKDTEIEKKERKRKREYRRDRAITACYSCNQTGHYLTNCPTGSRTKLLEIEKNFGKEKQWKIDSTN